MSELVAVLQRRQLGAELSHLEQRHHQEDEDQNGEAGEPVEAPGDLLEQAQQPDHVEALGEDAGDEDAVPFEPVGRLHIKRLEPLHVVQQPVADGAQRPGDHRGEDQDHDDGDAERDEESEPLGQALLEPLLKRPDDGQDEQREGEGGEHRAGEIKRRASQHDGADDGRATDRTLARLALCP